MPTPRRPSRSPSSSTKETEGAEQPNASQDNNGRPLFLHPQWMIYVVLIFGVAAILAGINNPVWLLIGSPCILVLLVYIWVKIKQSD